MNTKTSTLYTHNEARRKVLVDIRAKLTQLILDDLRVQDIHKDSRFICELFPEITENRITFSTLNLTGIIDLFKDPTIISISIKQKHLHSMEDVYQTIQSIEQEGKVVNSIERNLLAIKQIVRS